MVSIKLVTPPGAEPVTLEEAKAWLKLDTAEDDPIILRLIATARHMVEQYTSRALMTQTWRLLLPPSLNRPCLVLPKAPAIQMLAAYVQTDANTQTPLAGKGVWLDTNTDPPRLCLPPLGGMACGASAQAVFDIQFGYGDLPASVPAALRQAVLVMVAQAYEQRCAEDGLALTPAMPLLAPFILRRI